jgi:DNA-binding GntR family transcriptional regulator
VAVGRVTAQVEEKVRDLIKSGEYPPDKALPSERVLANEIGAGRTTVRLVLAKLASEGLIRAEHGRGYFAQTAQESAAEVPEFDLEPWTIHGERTVYDNRWVRLALVDVEPPGVERFEHHVVRLSRVAVAAVVDEADRVLMLWRYRFVPQRFGWELPVRSKRKPGGGPRNFTTSPAISRWSVWSIHRMRSTWDAGPPS